MRVVKIKCKGSKLPKTEPVGTTSMQPTRSQDEIHSHRPVCVCIYIYIYIYIYSVTVCNSCIQSFICILYTAIDYNTVLYSNNSDFRPLNRPRR